MELNSVCLSVCRLFLRNVVIGSTWKGSSRSVSWPVGKRDSFFEHQFPESEFFDYLTGSHANEGEDILVYQFLEWSCYAKRTHRGWKKLVRTQLSL